MTYGSEVPVLSPARTFFASSTRTRRRVRSTSRKHAATQTKPVLFSPSFSFRLDTCLLERECVLNFRSRG